MPLIPLGSNSYKRSDGFVPEVILRDMYLEKDESGISPDGTLRIQRPGLTRITRLGSDPVRGLHFRTSTAERLAVVGAEIFTGPDSRGFIDGSGHVAIASTPFLTLIATDSTLYRYDGAIATVALPDDAGSSVQDVDQLNGYGIVLLASGRFYWLEPGATIIEALNYATAESLPDKAVAVRRLGDEFWIFGTENVEVWQSTGDADAPFQRASGRNFERGCLHRDAVRRFDNTLVWVGDDYQVYRASAVPQVISTSGIAERVRKAAGECSAFTFGIEGHSFYVLTVPGQGTFAYDAATQAWSEFSTAGGAWLPSTGYQVNGSIVLGSSVDGRLWTVDPASPTDDGAVISRAVTATVAINGKPSRNDSVSIGVGASQDTIIRLRWKDGQDEFPDYYEELDVRAPYDIATLYRLGRPEQPYRTVEVSCIDPAARIRLSGAYANESWR